MSDTTSFYSSSSSEDSTAVVREASIASSGRPKSNSLQARVRAVDPNNGHCLLENSPEHCVVDWVHCFPKRKAGRETLMTSLEYHWNMPRGSLNLDTRYNVFPVRPHLRQVFEMPKLSGSWILVPEQHIVDQYHAQIFYEDFCWKTSRSAFPALENGVYTYQFVCIDPQDHMEDLAITRQECHSVQDCANNSTIQSKCTVYAFPFEDFPPVRSHLHPKFVILEAGRKLNGSFAMMFVDSLLVKYPILARICEIYAAWIEPCTDRQFIRSMPHTQDDTAASEPNTVDSAKYTPPPHYRSIWQRRTARKSSSSRSSQRSGNHPRRRRRSSNLSGRTLREHTRSVGKQQWDPKSLREWLKQCQPDEDYHSWEDPVYADASEDVPHQ